MNSSSLSLQRAQLPLMCVLVQCLDENSAPITGAYASGFIVREDSKCFLYTCWHVVTGYDPNDVRVGPSLPSRRFLRLSMQAANLSNPGMDVIGGLACIDLPLYKTTGARVVPAWLQDNRHIPNLFLNSIGIFVPFWHDLVKMELPPGLQLSAFQLIDSTRICPRAPAIGEKCLIAGYPYGYSVLGQSQPTAVVLTRFIAADRVDRRPRVLLLESSGAPGMSGGPAFLEVGGALLLFGIYTGTIYPDHVVHSNEKTTSLGSVCNICFALDGTCPPVAVPGEGVDPAT